MAGLTIGCWLAIFALPSRLLGQSLPAGNGPYPPLSSAQVVASTSDARSPVVADHGPASVSPILPAATTTNSDAPSQVPAAPLAAGPATTVTMEPNVHLAAVPPPTTRSSSTLPMGSRAPQSAQQTALGHALNQVPPSSHAAPSAMPLAWKAKPKVGGDRATQLRATGGFLLVLGGLLVAVWLMRGSRSSSQVVPAPVAELLGKLPFPGRPPLHLLRFGSKLVLISAQGQQVQTVAEVTDPHEVLRLTELCRVSIRRGTVDADLASEWAQRISQPELEVGGRLA